MGNSDQESTIDRRAFLSRSAKIAAGTAIATTALSYGRILGANDRISLGHIGIGNRGRGLDLIVAKLKGTQNVEMTAVCDLWSVNREKAVQANQEVFGRAPRGFANLMSCCHCAMSTPCSFPLPSIHIPRC